MDTFIETNAQYIPLMIPFCPILVYIILLLEASFISLLLPHILHIMFILLVSNLLFLLQLIRQPFFTFWSNFKGPSFKIFCSFLLHPWSYMCIVILIELLIIPIVCLPLIFMSFWVILLFVERIPHSRSIVLWHTLLVR